MICLLYYRKNVSEGGLARNLAFYNYLESKNYTIKNMYYRGKIERLLKILEFIYIIIVSKNKTIFFHINIIPLIFIPRFLQIKFYRNIVKNLFKNLSSRNKLVVEINDLSYEQAIDLELEVGEWWLDIEKSIYNLHNTKYIFASYKMCDYVVKKYNLKIENSSVIINGGPNLNKNLVEKTKKYINKNNKIKYIYAGSMNKGRQIEELINIFKNRENVELYLIGVWGEWIKEEIEDENIIYLGNFEENLAQAIVSHCDVGIIPYDDTRFYYNLCFPTKASFYITAGIPFLCTNLREVKDIFEKEDVVWFENIKNWEYKILEIGTKEIKQKKENVSKIKNRFLWKNLLERAKL